MGKRSSGRVFGHVEGVEVGQVYSNRILLAALTGGPLLVHLR